MANTSVAITPGSGATVGTFADSNSVNFQRVITAAEPSQKNTYFAAYKAQSIGTAATTNILTMAGSATKKVTVNSVLMAATATTTAVYFDVLVNRQSTADTGGTAATTATVVKADTNNATVTAVAPLFYTAGPTAGTVTGLMAARKLFAPVTGTPAPVTTVELVPQLTTYGQGIALNGVADVLAFTVNAVTPGAATSWDVTVIWTEE